MKMYDLYLDSGPKMKKTMVQVPALLGCTLRGDTSDEAIARAPDTIRAYLRFLQRHGENVDPDGGFRVRVAEHVTTNQWPGMGVGFLPTDEQSLTDREAALLMKRLGAIHAALRARTAKLKPAQLDRKPATGRPIRRILSHVCGEGNYLRQVPGASRIQRLVDQGALDPHDALDQLFELENARIASMSKEERSSVIMRGQTPWSARSAVRRMLEHAWEHYVEITERVGESP